MMNLEIPHRSGLIYDEKLTIIEVFWHAWQGAAMLAGASIGDAFQCTCYSRLHWRWFGYMSPSYCTTWSSLVLACFRFLLDHVLGPCCSTYQFSSGAHVVLRFDHVSLLHWTMCCIFISPRDVTTIPRVSFFYSTTCLDAVCPRVSILLGHMSRPELPTCLFLIQARGRIDLYHVFGLYWPTCPILALIRVIHWFIHVLDSY